jgi:hypothetical protein
MQVLKLALRAGAVNARRPRGMRGRRRPNFTAKSIDRDEHSGILKGVMAVA